MQVIVMDLMGTVAYYNVELCRALKRTNVNVTLATPASCLDPQYSATDGIQRLSGMTDRVAKVLGPPSVRRILKLGEYITNLCVCIYHIARWRPDALHVQFLPLATYYGLPIEYWFLKIVRACRIPIIYTVHNVLPHDTGNARASVFRRIYSAADLLICHNQTAQEELVRDFGIDAERVRVIPHGPLLPGHDAARVSHARTALGIPDNECVVLWQGHVKPYKGVPFLLDAWNIVHRQRANATLFIVGSGDSQLYLEFEQQVEQLGIASSVRLVCRFMGVRELAEYYEAADIIVYPYRDITTSGALMTGLNYKKPIIVTDLPAFRELMNPVDPTVIIQYGDRQSLASAIIRLIDDPARRIQLGAKQAELLPCWTEIGAQTLAAYEIVAR
jgi:glycosyltransferase involved in cell wall biosynthesis